MNSVLSLGRRSEDSDLLAPFLLGELLAAVLAEPVVPLEVVPAVGKGPAADVEQGGVLSALLLEAGLGLLVAVGAVNVLRVVGAELVEGDRGLGVEDEGAGQMLDGPGLGGGRGVSPALCAGAALNGDQRTKQGRNHRERFCFHTYPSCSAMVMDVCGR
jgi:hypothetical protein